ncbi:MAG: S41 family peptidase [Gemmatimonadaceae bacterium]
MWRKLVLLSLAGASGCVSAGSHAPAPAPAPAPARRSSEAIAPGGDDPVEPGIAVATFDSAWSRVKATYYDSTLKGVDWDAVRRELRPRAEHARTRAALRALLLEMLSPLADSHMMVLPAEFAAPALHNDSAGSARPGGVGIETRIVDRELHVWRVEPGSAAARAGVRPGWVVDSIDGAPVRPGIARVDSLPNENARRVLFAQVTAKLQNRFEMGGPAGAPLAVAFRDAHGRSQRRAMIRDTAGTPVKVGHMPTLVLRQSWRRVQLSGGDCVGIVRFNYWLIPILPEIAKAMSALGECRGIAIDLRGNVGGMAAILSGVSGFFVDTAATLAFVRSRGGETRYDVFPRRATPEGRRVEPFRGPLAILLDPLSASTSEVFAAGMRQIGRARLFGEKTAGQALPAFVTKLPSGDALMHVVGDLRLGDGTRIEGAGVRPDVELALVRADLLAQRDAVLDAAIYWIAMQNLRTGAR